MDGENESRQKNPVIIPAFETQDADMADKMEKKFISDFVSMGANLLNTVFNPDPTKKKPVLKSFKVSPNENKEIIAAMAKLAKGSPGTFDFSKFVRETIMPVARKVNKQIKPLAAI